MLLGSITTRSILSRLSMQVQRYLHNKVKPSVYSDSMLTMERGKPSTHPDRSSGTKAMSFMIDLSRLGVLNTSVHLTATYYLLTLTRDYRTYHRYPTHRRSSMMELPHIMFSSSAEWNPTVLDNKLSSQPTGSTSSRMILKTDTYVLPLSMLTGTTYTDK